MQGEFKKQLGKFELRLGNLRWQDSYLLKFAVGNFTEQQKKGKTRLFNLLYNPAVELSFQSCEKCVAPLEKLTTPPAK